MKWTIDAFNLKYRKGWDESTKKKIGQFTTRACDELQRVRESVSHPKYGKVGKYDYDVIMLAYEKMMKKEKENQENREQHNPTSFIQSQNQITRPQYIKPIETIYNGYRFRSRLEARWAVFFDACGAKWEYEPEGYDLGNGIWYLPDFRIREMEGRGGPEIFVEVKGVMDQKDADKINSFAGVGIDGEFEMNKLFQINVRNKILVLPDIPKGDTIDEITDNIKETAYTVPVEEWPYYFNFRLIDGDYFAAHPGVNESGGFELFGDHGSYLREMDDEKTEIAYRKARQARFEHGERG